MRALMILATVVLVIIGGLSGGLSVAIMLALAGAFLTSCLER